MRRLRNLPRLLMAGLVLLLGIAQPTLSEVFCVDTALGLQNALSTAAVNGQDDEVWTIQGTYIGNFDYASTEANKLRVLGGYTAGCAGRVLDPANTLLDGHQTNTVLVLSAPDVAAEFLVEGLTLRHGQRTGEGGGLYAKVLGAVTVNRNRIENNMAGANSDGNGGEGGGASISATTVTLTHNSITGNATSGFFDGGGGGVAISATTATLTDNSITGNTTSRYLGGKGGGAYISATTATLTDNSITGNSSFRDAYYSSSLGGGVSISATTATLTNNSIMGNGASLGGGAHIYATTATLIQNSITGNVGGGIYTGVMNTSAGTATTLNHNSITGNTGGGASISADTVTLTNNRIMSNTAKMDWRGEGDGGGASISAITATLINNNITGNTARMGGGLDLSLGDTETHDAARLYNNLFWDNVANANEGSDLLIDNDRDGDYLPTPVILLANNFDQAQPSGFSITLPITLDPTNLNQLDPLFVDASAGNFHLQPGSPMVDAGYPGTPDLPDFDIEGTPRVLGAAVDIGAYEYDDGSNAKAILSIARAGNGSGQVTSNPSGIACGSDCFHIYDIDTLVTLTAKPNAGSVFTGWALASCSEAFPLIEDTTCTANFDILNPFGDVDPASWAYGYIYAIRDAGITGGCGNDNYCPQGLVTREQMAAFLIRAIEGDPDVGYCNGVDPFLDVDSGAWSCPHIKRLGELNITGGCGQGNYCPQGLVTRAQMAVFIVRALEGNPSANYCDGVAPFNDIPASSWSCGHIKRLVELGVTQGCGNGNYCPDSEVNREQMAAFLARAFLNRD